MHRYWLDANVLIEAHNRSYPFDVATTFWRSLAGQIEEGNIVSARRVYKEVAEQERHQDAVANFVRSRRQYLCQPSSKEVDAFVGKVEDYIFNSGRYLATEAWRFSRGADPWVIAHAAVDSGVVVTKESALRPEAQVIRIPDVCSHFEVKCVDTIEMFRQLGITF